MTARRIRRVLALGIGLLVFLVLAGATYQGVATAFERRRFPRPGQLTDVGGHQLHLYCTGEGRPTVVLEAPAAGMSASWAWVQRAVATTSRVCSYDRAGLGWSEAGDGAFAADAVPGQLQSLLTTAGERPPYIIAGQGFGAALARLEAEQFGADVIGLVLIDPPGAQAVSGARLVTWSPWLARIGLLRISGMLSDRAAGLPQPLGDAFTAFLNRPDHLARASIELSHWDDVAARSVQVPLPPGLPVVEVHIMGDQRVAFLSTAETSAPAIAAVREAVEAARRHD